MLRSKKQHQQAKADKEDVRFAPLKRIQARHGEIDRLVYGLTEE
jgi:hypothetical protein